MELSNFDPAAFLRDYWQQKPVVLRAAWPDWRNPLDPDELAGLACEDGVEARLVSRAPGGWELEHGPLPEDRFAKLGKTPWTLLVQAVDHHVPAVAELLSAFRFIPNWRIEDVMVSYAVDGGGVGPHFDQYDVFLIQGLGRRRWQIGDVCDEHTALAPDPNLRLLADFAPTAEWVLEPGDILYLPPRVAHDGVAVGSDCMTYSVGFRAPSRAELITAWAESIAADLTDDDRYSDPGLALQDNPGEISVDAMGRLHAMVAEKLGDRGAFANWFGQFASRPKNPEIDWRPDNAPNALKLKKMLAGGTDLLRNPAARFAFIGGAGGAVTLFVDGEAYACEGAQALFAQRLCAADRVDVAVEERDCDTIIDLILTLVDRGNLAPSP